jgi:putative transposase
VPWGLKRLQASGQTHFVTFCCYHRRPWFTTSIPKQVFEAGLERVPRSFELCVYGYVVMPEQVHLLLSEAQPSMLGDAMKSLKQGGS